MDESTQPPEQVFICQTCNKGFKNAKYLRKHQIKHSGAEHRFSCLHCDKRFTKPSILHVHELLHTDERKFVCQQSYKSFKNVSNLNKHELGIMHTGKPPYECQIGICDKKYSQAAGLSRHALIHTYR